MLFRVVQSQQRKQKLTQPLPTFCCFYFSHSKMEFVEVESKQGVIPAGVSPGPPKAWVSPLLFPAPRVPTALQLRDRPRPASVFSVKMTEKAVGTLGHKRQGAKCICGISLLSCGYCSGSFIVKQIKRILTLWSSVHRL